MTVYATPLVHGGTAHLRPRVWSTVSGTATSASTTIVAAEAGKKIMVGAIYFCNSGSVNAANVALKWSTAATEFYGGPVSLQGVKFLNLVQCELDPAPAGDSLALVLDTTGSPSVKYTISYTYVG